MRGTFKKAFIDALSFIEMQKSFAGDILVMNSIALLNKSLEHLKNYPDINLFLDNDNAGIKCRSEIIRSFASGKDHSGIYSNHKDLNEFLIHKMKNNVLNKAGKQSEKFPEQDKQHVREQKPEIKNSNSFKRKR